MLLGAGSLIFVLIGLWMLLTPGHVLDNGTILVTLLGVMSFRIVGIVTIVFFGFCAVYIGRKMYDDRPGLIINDEGITDCSSGAAVGLVKWRNITGIRTTEIVGQKFISLDVNNADEIIADTQGAQRKLVAANNKLYKSPVHIAATSLKCSFEELEKMIVVQLENRNIIQPEEKFMEK